MSAHREPKANTESVDDYLKVIFHLGGVERRVSGGAIAEKLAVSNASVTNMIQKLAAAAMPLLHYERHGGTSLTEHGRRRALEIIRHHRLIETFLFQELGYPLAELHDEAERLEHFISEQFELRLAAKLGNPTVDPHGHCIPALDGSMPSGHGMFCQCEPGTRQTEGDS